MCDYSNCNDNLKHTLGGMIIAMEKFQIEGDSLDASNNVLQNVQSNESVSNVFQDMSRSYKCAFSFGPNTFNKKSSVQVKKSDCIDMPSTNVVKMQPRKRLKKRK